jgi:hypothetical protein
MMAHKNTERGSRFMALTLHARGLLALATLVFVAAPTFADEDPTGLCEQLAVLADAGNDGRFHQVGIVWKKDTERVACSGEGKAEKYFCRWFSAQPNHSQWISTSQAALACLGHDRLPPSDPDEFVIDSWWSRGAFAAESGPLFRERVRFTMDMNKGEKTGPSWIVFTAEPK